MTSSCAFCQGLLCFVLAFLCPFEELYRALEYMAWWRFFGHLLLDLVDFGLDLRHCLLVEAFLLYELEHSHVLLEHFLSVFLRFPRVLPFPVVGVSFVGLRGLILRVGAFSLSLAFCFGGYPLCGVLPLSWMSSGLCLSAGMTLEIPFPVGSPLRRAPPRTFGTFSESHS